jgi:hypothetical protein
MAHTEVMVDVEDDQLDVTFALIQQLFASIRAA